MKEKPLCVRSSHFLPFLVKQNVGRHISIVSVTCESSLGNCWNLRIFFLTPIFGCLQLIMNGKLNDDLIWKY